MKNLHTLIQQMFFKLFQQLVFAFMKEMILWQRLKKKVLRLQVWKRWQRWKNEVLKLEVWIRFRHKRTRKRFIFCIYIEVKYKGSKTGYIICTEIYL